ncbi:MAG: CBS domain-containing protein [Azospirillaceae bacterium]|nr:CBS domain-containing protein [Azospirillaceae bacterium]
MKIADLLVDKGRIVISISPGDTIAAAARLLLEKGIGAIVVRDRLGKLVGILSERDIVRGLALQGGVVTTLKVADLMTTAVTTGTPQDTVKDVMETMTLRRIRHLPVVDNGALIGVISIGDVLKSRLEERGQEVAVLRDISLVRA